MKENVKVVCYTLLVVCILGLFIWLIFFNRRPDNGTTPVWPPTTHLGDRR
jgi:hypothetical protein